MSIPARLRLPDDAIVPPDDGQRRAAVAIVLDDDRVLLMVRATRESDPWSGHISLPGGGFHATDAHLQVTAMRETVEELGIALDTHRYLGRMAALHPFSSGPSGVEVTPFVFAVAGPVSLSLGPEAAAAFWFPLDRALRGELDGTHELVRAGTTMKFPCWRYGDHTIWGLTWRILTQLAERASDPSAASPP